MFFIWEKKLMRQNTNTRVYHTPRCQFIYIYSKVVLKYQSTPKGCMQTNLSAPSVLFSHYVVRYLSSFYHNISVVCPHLKYQHFLHAFLGFKEWGTRWRMKIRYGKKVFLADSLMLTMNNSQEVCSFLVLSFNILMKNDLMIVGKRNHLFIFLRSFELVWMGFALLELRERSAFNRPRRSHGEIFIPFSRWLLFPKQA